MAHGPGAALLALPEDGLEVLTLRCPSCECTRVVTSDRLQKSQGVNAGQMLDVLGLGVSEGVAVDDDELWEAMLSMGIRLIRPAIPVRCRAFLISWGRACSGPWVLDGPPPPHVEA